LQLSLKNLIDVAMIARLHKQKKPLQLEKAVIEAWRIFYCSGYRHTLAMFTQTANHDNRRLAKFLYWQGWSVTSVAEYLNEKRATVESWRVRDGWANAPVVQRLEGIAEYRVSQLILKDQKSGADYKEIDLLGRQMERYARIRKYADGGNEADLNPNLNARNDKPKKRPEKNFLTDEQIEKLIKAFKESVFDYQMTWWENRLQRTRVILKSRQIGATWYFAREALIDALQTGNNQIFLSASRSQAFVFRNYITQFVKDITGVELKCGNELVLANGATIYFLGTNARTAQSYHGNLYFDEFFWVDRFEQLNKVASGMAIHKKWRKTYFSTPSSMSHEAYPFWKGEKFAKRSGAVIDVSHAHLKDGVLGPDKVWRQIVNIYDAEAGGCDLFDIEHLKTYDYSEDQFANLCMCEFIDDTQSVFPLARLQKCMVDAWEEWTDYKPHLRRPFGYMAVWIGYDPSLSADAAGLAVISPPKVPGGKFRILERHSLRNLDFAQQANTIRELTLKYTVAHIAIDTTGIGAAVFQLVQQWYPAVVGLNYSIELKTRLVLKAQYLMKNGRLEFDAGHVDIAQSFMAIRKQITNSGRHATYNAGRTEATGHSDVAWAVMNALDHEPLEGHTDLNQNIMEIS